LIFALILTGIGFAAAFLTSLVCLLAAVIAWSISVAYTSVGKRSGLLGNFLVSAVVSVPFIYGSLALLGTVKLNVLFFVAMVFFSITGREITKGIVDVEGDKTQGVKTLAVRYGERNAAIAATMFYVSAVALTPIPWFLRIVSVLFLPFVAITDIGLIVSSLLLLKNYSRENARKIKNVVLIWFLFGFLAFAVSAV
jgi:geranylgeranylglycerol-phosphate geranylgeranyltransferase